MSPSAISSAAPIAFSASSVEVQCSAGTLFACRSCSSCTVHSMSASPPRPGLVWVFGSAPRGSRSASTRALIRRISCTASCETPPFGVARLVDHQQETLSQVQIACDPVRAQQRLHFPGLRILSRSRPDRRRAFSPTGRFALRAAGWCRPPEADPQTACPAACAPSPPPRPTTSPRPIPQRPRSVRRRTSRRRPIRSPVRRHRGGPSRSRRCGAGGPSSPVLSRITASSAACNTATHTVVSAWHTSVT